MTKAINGSKDFRTPYLGDNPSKLNNPRLPRGLRKHLRVAKALAREARANQEFESTRAASLAESQQRSRHKLQEQSMREIHRRVYSYDY